MNSFQSDDYSAAGNKECYICKESNNNANCKENIIIKISVYIFRSINNITNHGNHIKQQRCPNHIHTNDHSIIAIIIDTFFGREEASDI